MSTYITDILREREREIFNWFWIKFLNYGNIVYPGINFPASKYAILILLPILNHAAALVRTYKTYKKM